MVKYNLDGAVTISNMMSLDFCPKEKLNVCVQSTANQMYTLLNYDKNYTCQNDLYIGLYRSVIFSFPNKRLLSISPSKFVEYSFFKSLFPQLNEQISITEYIHGFVIQLFYDERIHKWEIATKEYIGGREIYFYDPKKRSIHDIFIECLGGNDNDTLDNIPFLEYFPENCCFTFVIDVTCNHDNVNINYIPYLTAVHSIKNNLPNVVKYIPDTTYSHWDCIESIKGIIELPKKFFFGNYNDMFEQLIYDHTPCRFVVTNHNTGIRCKVESDEYTVQKNARQNHPFEYYLFFCLKRIYSPYKLYDAYPAYSKKLYKVKTIYENMISNIHQSYLDYFVKKESNELPKQYEKYLRKIHTSIYIPSIKSKTPQPITRTVVKKFFDELAPNELMHMLYR